MKNENLLKGLVVAMALASPMANAQTNYPPAFEPQVLYRDADLISKHANNPQVAAPKATTANNTVAPQTSVTSAAAKSAPAGTASSVSASGSGESSDSSNMFLVLGVVALAGGVFWFSRKGSTKSNASNAQSLGGTTGSQYVEAVSGSGVETGVSRYIKALPQVVVSSTGVAKYLRNLPPPEVAGPVETGVTKYLKGLPKPPILPTDETGVAKYLKSI